MRPRVLALKGEVFGSLTVEAPAEAPEGMPGRRSYWLCRCKCGRTEVIAGQDLTGNRRKRCRACSESINNLAGQVFGNWKVDRRATADEMPDHPSAAKMSWWRVICVRCGAEAIRSRPQLRHLKQQCSCIKVNHPRPFIPRTVEDSKPVPLVPMKQAKCAYKPCGKVFELESGGQWGWNIGRDLFCTYKHMRAQEKLNKEQPKRGRKYAQRYDCR